MCVCVCIDGGGGKSDDSFTSYLDGRLPLHQVEAENFPELSMKYEVVAVPTFILLKAGLRHS